MNLLLCVSQNKLLNDYKHLLLNLAMLFIFLSPAELSQLANIKALIIRSNVRKHNLNPTDNSTLFPAMLLGMLFLLI